MVENSIFQDLIDVPQDLKDVPQDFPYAYVDGSFNKYTNVCGYGGFLINGNDTYILTGTCADCTHPSHIVGEVEGAMMAVKCAEELGIRNLEIRYDYLGIEKWALSEWETKKDFTRAYKEFMNSPERKVKLSFTKVPAHTGVKGNEFADVIAKQSVGINLTYLQRKVINDFMKEI